MYNQPAGEPRGDFAKSFSQSKNLLLAQGQQWVKV